jgi:LCP family protein required for cell wall assembly
MPGWQKAIIFLLVLASVLMAATVFVVWNKLGHIDRIGDEDRISANDEDFETDDDGRDNTLSDTAVNFSSGEVLSDQNVINILLIGRDARGSERGRSDSMIVLSLNRNTKQISMVSLMRDCYVQIPGYSNNKLNAAFSFGGYELLDQTIQKNFGIQIDYNVGVNFDGFEQVVDQLGGIDITLTSGEAEYMALWGFPYMTEGVNHMTGEQALCYARTRYVGTGKESNDFGRTYRQRMVLTTVYQEMMKKPLTEIWTILDSIMDCIETDMTNTQIISIGTEFYNMGISNLQSYRLPQDNGYSDEKINGMAVLVVDWDKARQNLQDWLYSDTPVATHDITASN